MIRTLAIENYRSLRSLVIPLSRLNVVTGENGSGKSSLYRALRLLANAATGELVRALAQEGGMASTLWAGPEQITRGMRRGTVPVEGTRRSKPVAIKLGFVADEFGYSIELGLPPYAPNRIPPSKFTKDPAIKRESLWSGAIYSPGNALVDRRNGAITIRGGDRGAATDAIAPGSSMLAEFADPNRAPELLWMRERVRSWRFYDQFRTDLEAPVRAPRIGTFTPVLDHDGRDLAAAIESIVELGGGATLRSAIDDAFPGSAIEIVETDGLFRGEWRQPGMLRPLSLAELSDGTLRFLMWITALHSARPPELLVLNEPETSLHPDLLPALGRAIVRAAENTQLWVVTHSSTLIDVLAAAESATTLRLAKVHGETIVVGQSTISRPRWNWPPR